MGGSIGAQMGATTHILGTGVPDSGAAGGLHEMRNSGDGTRMLQVVGSVQPTLEPSGTTTSEEIGEVSPTALTHAEVF